MTRQADTENDLIARYIVSSADGTPDRARLAGSGVEVWALIGYLRAYSVDETAVDYDLPREAVEAALAYYEQNRGIIDARLAANAA